MKNNNKNNENKNNTMIAKEEATTMFKYEEGISEKTINTLENIYKMAKNGVSYVLPPIRKFGGDFDKQIAAELTNSTIEKAAELERKGRGMILDLFESSDIITKKHKKLIFAQKNGLDKIYRTLKSGLNSAATLDDIIENPNVKIEVTEENENHSVVKEEIEAEEPVKVEVVEEKVAETVQKELNETVQEVVDSTDTVVLTPVVVETESAVEEESKVKEESAVDTTRTRVVMEDGHMTVYHTRAVCMEGNPEYEEKWARHQEEIKKEEEEYNSEAARKLRESEERRIATEKAEAEALDKKIKDEHNALVAKYVKIQRPHTILGVYYSKYGRKQPIWEIHSEDINGERIAIGDISLCEYVEFAEAHPEHFDIVELIDNLETEIDMTKVPEKFKAALNIKGDVVAQSVEEEEDIVEPDEIEAVKFVIPEQEVEEAEEEVKAEPEVEAKAEVKDESKVETKAKEEPKSETKEEMKQEPKAEVKEEVKEAAPAESKNAFIPKTDAERAAFVKAMMLKEKEKANTPKEEFPVCDKVIPAGKIGIDVDFLGKVRYTYDKNGKRIKLIGVGPVQRTTMDYKKNPDKYFVVLWIYGYGQYHFNTQEELQAYTKTKKPVGNVTPASVLRVEGNPVAGQAKPANKTDEGIVNVNVDDRPDVSSAKIDQAVEKSLKEEKQKTTNFGSAATLTGSDF